MTKENEKLLDEVEQIKFMSETEQAENKYLNKVIDKAQTELVKSKNEKNSFRIQQK